MIARVFNVLRETGIIPAERMHRPPSATVRLPFAVAVAFFAAIQARGAAARFGPWWVAGDFTYWWRAARALLDGHSPYAVIQPTGPYPFQGGFVYPLTAAVATLPVAPFPPVTALMLFAAASGGLLAWAATRDGYHRLPLFLAPAFTWGVADGQWGALLTAAALTPALGWVATIKPTLGVGVLSYRPTRLAIALCAAFVLVSLAVQPSWPVEWLAAAGRERGNYRIPALSPWGGPLLLLAFTRWRRPEGRLLALLACVPQSPFFYDQLMLWLVPQTVLQSAVLTALNFACERVYLATAPPALLAMGFPERNTHHLGDLAAALGPIVVVLLYLPCLAMLLRRPNVGDVPAWAERVAARVRERHGAAWARVRRGASPADKRPNA